MPQHGAASDLRFASNQTAVICTEYLTTMIILSLSVLTPDKELSRVQITSLVPQSSTLPLLEGYIHTRHICVVKDCDQDNSKRESVKIDKLRTNAAPG